MSRKNKSYRAFVHQNPNATAKDAWDAAWANEQGRVSSLKHQEKDDTIAALRKELEEASESTLRSVEKLAVKNANLRKEIEGLKERQPSGYITKNAEKFLRLGNNMCDLTILQDSGEHNCVPIFLAPATELAQAFPELDESAQGIMGLSIGEGE